MQAKDALDVLKALVGLVVATLNVAMMIAVSNSVKAAVHGLNDQIALTFTTGIMALIAFMTSYYAVIERQYEVAFTIPVFTLIYISSYIIMLTPDRYLLTYLTLFSMLTLSLLLNDFKMIAITSIWVMYTSILIGAIFVAVVIPIAFTVIYFAFKKVHGNVDKTAVLTVTLASIYLAIVNNSNVKSIEFIGTYILTLFDVFSDAVKNGLSTNIFENLKPRIKHILVKTVLIILSSMLTKMDIQVTLIYILSLIVIHSVVRPQR